MLLAVGVVSGSVGGALALYSAWSYRPLATGSLGNTSVWLMNGTLAPTEPTLTPGTAATVWRIPSTTFTAGLIVAVANRGRFAVTIDHVGFPAWGGTSHYESRLEAPSDPRWTGGTTFHPITLRPGHEQLVALTFEMACVNLDGQVTIPTVPVEYEFMGVHHTTALRLVEPLIIGGPSSCPGRK